MPAIRILSLAVAAALFAGVNPLIAASPAAAKAPPPAAPPATYADLADLADSAPIVLRAQVRKVLPVEPARATGLRPGHGRFYIEARTVAFLSGSGLIGEGLRYLVDLPLDARGKPPKLNKADVLLFARDPRGRPGDIQLVAPDGQVRWDPASEASLRAILAELHGPNPPPRVGRLFEAIHVPGTLAGEGETQFSLLTGADTAASITVIHRSGQRPTWSVSFSEVVGGGGVPTRETLAWYRLACFLPAALPPGTNLSATRIDAAQAESDWRLVRRDLGECPRNRN
jgi:hypothetical protein